MTDVDYLTQTIRLARRGIGCVSPNPLVGALVVNAGKIVGRGFHRAFGEAHAEVVALRDAGDKARGATLYVNLEPCCHYGKTPPCTDAIIQSGIRRVVVGIVDPNPIVNHRGIDILQQHGIRVDTGIAEESSRRLNRAFIKFIVSGMPYITLKIAQSMDGRIATANGHSRWITSEPSRTFVHRMRRENDAVIIGVGTVNADDPQLSVRHVKGRTPFRIVLDSALSIPIHCQLLKDAYREKTVIATCAKDVRKIDIIEQGGARVWQFDGSSDNHVPLPDLLHRMAGEGMSSAMVEGGKQVFTSFICSGLADRFVAIMAPKLLGAGIEAIGDLGIKAVEKNIPLHNVKVRKSGPDIIIQADLHVHGNH